jgi:hypothetical protein
MNSIEHTNYLVGAKCYFNDKDFDVKDIQLLNRTINNIMLRKDFSSDDVSYFYNDSHLRLMTFYFNIPSKSPSIKMRLKKFFDLINQTDFDDYIYLETLKFLTDEHPRKVIFSIKFGNIKENIKGYIVSIETEPLIVSKIRQIGYKPKIDNITYNNIIEYNKRFINEIITSIGAGILEGPKAISPLDKIPHICLFEEDILQLIPKDIANCLREANKCFSVECYIATSIMIRKTLEIAINKKFYQTNNEKRLYINGDEISLGKKLNILSEIMPNKSRIIKEIEIVKWFGDSGAHDPKNPIFSRDIENNIAPKIRSFLINMELKQ